MCNSQGVLKPKQEWIYLGTCQTGGIKRYPIRLKKLIKTNCEQHARDKTNN